MKKIFYITTIIIGLAVVVMAYAFNIDNNTKGENPPNCWSTITVNWSGGCVFPDDNTNYVVNLKIWNECVDPDSLVYDSIKIVKTIYTSTTFCILNSLCNIDEQQTCMHVIASVAKVNVNTNQIICRGQQSDYKNCGDLMSGLNLYPTLN